MPKPPQEGPNPLFTRWLEEWRDQAKENGRLKSQRAYERVGSEHIPHGSEAWLKEFVTRISGGPIPTSPCKDREDVDDPTYSDRPVLPPALSSLEPVQHPEQHSKKKQAVPRHRARGYMPTRRSPAYAILLALNHNTLKPESRGYLTKPELQKSAQPLCDKSFFLADPGSKNTAWSAVSTLIRKELVLKTNIPARSSCEGPNSGLSKPQFVLRPGQFDVILCVDFIETTGGPASRKQELVRELQRHNVPFSIRKLHVGDFLWVARERGPHGAELLPPTTARELVLDYVVERKRMPDLCGSIIDGRFREQKVAASKFRT
ncbi:hypothetical protein L345_16855, partial [Ophiophagus hannah]